MLKQDSNGADERTPLILPQAADGEAGEGGDRGDGEGGGGGQQEPVPEKPGLLRCVGVLFALVVVLSLDGPMYSFAKLFQTRIVQVALNFFLKNFQTFRN